LREGGYLAIVIPDGILTNSSLQYVRDWIEEKFRIVAVVSLPQTAFQSTGAGVKSSVLFLKKYDLATTENIQARKLVLQDEIKIKHNYEHLLTELDKEKKEQIKKLIGFDKGSNLEGKALQDSEDFKEWKKEVNNEYRERIDEIKENLVEEYITEKQRLFNDYEIFMAIAEDIGYDATGKATNNNELDLIGEELTRFIDSIERGKDSFFLGDNLDKNKIFLVKLRELEGRFDPIFYNPTNINNEYKIKKSKWGFDKIGNIANRLVDGPFGSDLKVEEYQKEGVPLLRVSNLSSGEIDGNIVFISQEKHKQLKRSTVYPNDVLLTKAGAILGYSAVFPEKLKEGNITSHLVTISCKNIVNPKYLSYFFKANIGKIQIYRWGNKSTRPELNTSEVKNILVTLPPLEIQNQIVEIMDNAYNTKKQKEAEAQRLLDSIDDYLLGELGIELPQPEENTVTNRIFYRKLSDISGSRFDSPAHHKQFSLETQFYPMEKLSNWVLINPLTRFSGYQPDDTASFIPMENISEVYGEVEVSQTRKIKESEGYTKFLENDLIWAKITPCMENGKSAVVTKLINNIGFGSTEYHVFRAKIDINIKYIHALLCLKSLRIYAKLYFSGSVGHQRVSDKFFKQLLIPIPPLEKQNEIAEHITKIREKAKQLQEEAKRELEEAKIEVEKMILGD
jgi:type I restriction enzyme M protein